MAEVIKVGTPSLSTQAPQPANRLTGLLAGEALGANDACYIKNDGLVYRSIGAAANAAARVDGWAFSATPAGEAVTLLHDVNVRYGSNLTPGARLYVSATVPGGLSDTATTGGVSPVAFVVDKTRIRVLRSTY
jgi:hypothetical protein